jgi:hypothetical protein
MLTIVYGSNLKTSNINLEEKVEERINGQRGIKSREKKLKTIGRCVNDNLSLEGIARIYI